MTKEELARKKGVQAKKAVQTAAESLITTKTDIEEKPATESAEKEIAFEAQTPKKKAEKTASRKSVEEPAKVGRPKGKPSTKISLNVPNEYLDAVKMIAGVYHNGNTSSYIISLIEKDMEENGANYRKLRQLKK